LTPYANILNIAYLVDPVVPDGVYQAMLKNILLTFEDDSQVSESEIPITITKSMTGIPMVKASDVKVMLHDGVLSIDTESSEKVEIYSVAGKLLNSFVKSQGRVDKNISNLGGQVLIVKGKNWAAKVI